MNLFQGLTSLVNKKSADIDHDLLQKNAYVVVRWARDKFDTLELQQEQAVRRLASKFPMASDDNVDEAIRAMSVNMRAELGQGGKGGSDGKK